jgi:hypothetical protein
MPLTMPYLNSLMSSFRAYDVKVVYDKKKTNERIVSHDTSVLYFDYVVFPQEMAVAHGPAYFSEYTH